MKIYNYEFQGPYSHITALQDRGGIYVILDNINNQYMVIDVGESTTVRTRVEAHDRKACWHSNSTGTLYVAVLYVSNDQQRHAIEQELRAYYQPACGVM